MLNYQPTTCCTLFLVLKCLLQKLIAKQVLLDKSWLLLMLPSADAIFNLRCIIVQTQLWACLIPLLLQTLG